jgi:hypothetical protein
MSSGETRDPKAVRCPACASTNTTTTVQTNYGAYWRCSDCGHTWHEDARPRPKMPPFFERCGAAVMFELGRDLIDLRSKVASPPIRYRKACA